ncbi:two-component response regulator [Collibacillus ludicampi]|uniref:Two-component response regulator n=1 Tax=Collibacillus ludicampi TaxID=2771369 RepID=A0AAV4LCA5_9BACL|nr:response regulator transcription factor [Collibacillus ludicampi]GIM45087.1 two-component response regulator [Collibacillus ludicampi]
MAGEYILVVDDEKEIGELLALYLKRERFLYDVVSTGQDAIVKVQNEKPDLVILDVFLPDLEGYEVCKELRKYTDVPILFLSCKDSEWDKVIGLSIGADDYISKPFRANELIARIKAHLRRNRKLKQHVSMIQAEPCILSSQSLKIDLKQHEAFLHNKQLDLSAKEFQLLAFFMNHPKQVLSTEHLLSKIWGYEVAIDTKTVKVHIANLRKKIENDPKEPEKIITVKGVGYKFNEETTKYTSYMD